MTTVPTALQRAGNFSQTFNQDGTLATIYNPFTTRLVNGQYVRDPFPGNVIPTQYFDPVAVNLLKYYPAPNRPGNAVTGVNNFVGYRWTTDQ